MTKDEPGKGEPRPLRVAKFVSLALLREEDKATALEEVAELRKLEHPHLVGYHAEFVKDQPPMMCVARAGRCLHIWKGPIGKLNQW